MPQLDDQLSAALAEIRHRRSTAFTYNDWHGIALDADKLLAAVVAVLAVHHLVTDDDAHCDECRHLPHCGNCGGPWPCLEYQAISEAIARELTGKGNESG